MRGSSDAKRGCRPSLPPTRTRNPLFFLAIVPVAQMLAHFAQYTHLSWIIVGPLILSNIMAPSIHVLIHDLQLEHEMSEIITELAAIMPISEICGIGQLLGQQAIVTLN